MAHLIDKDALVAWAESQIDILERNSGCSGIFGEIQMAVFDRLYSFLDTLEVKEVDLEKEFYNFLDTLIGKDNGHLSEDELFRIAEYFYELGLKARKGE